MPPDYRIVIGALLDGGGWLALSLALFAPIAFPVRRGEHRARLAPPLLALAFNIPALSATPSVLRYSPATPPWYGVAGTCALAPPAFAIGRPWQIPAPSRPT